MRKLTYLFYAYLITIIIHAPIFPQSHTGKEGTLRHTDFQVINLSGNRLPNITSGQDDNEIWKEFVAMLKADVFTVERMRPYHDALKEPIMGFLKTMREKAAWEEWETTPEVHRVENQVHYLIPLTFDGQKATYSFSFLIEEGQWYFQHLEAVTIRLDKISSLPASKFPDLPEEQKARMREEIRVSEQVRLFNLLRHEKGRDFAFSWFKDGAGYFLAAKAWVPFVPASEAFILYLCWEQANLRGNKVTLEKLDKNEAVVRMTLIYFELYQQAGHLKQQISFEDYRKLFETIWLDRASKAGWVLQIRYKGEECFFEFKKRS